MPLQIRITYTSSQGVVHLNGATLSHRSETTTEHIELSLNISNTYISNSI